MNTPVATTFDLAKTKYTYNKSSNSLTVFVGSNCEKAWQDEDGEVYFPEVVACKGHTSTKVFTSVHNNTYNGDGNGFAALYTAPCGMKLFLM